MLMPDMVGTLNQVLFAGEFVVLDNEISQLTILLVAFIFGKVDCKKIEGPI